MIVYLNILERLEQSGWSSYRLRREHVLAETTMTRLRNGESVSVATLDVICRLCSCQPGDILQYIPDAKKERE